MPFRKLALRADDREGGLLFCIAFCFVPSFILFRIYLSQLRKAGCDNIKTLKYKNAET